jgi:anti-sigma-K factor RskA
LRLCVTFAPLRENPFRAAQSLELVRDDTGRFVLNDELRDLALKDPQFAVTLEPAGGGTRSTGPFYFSP